MRGEGQAIQSTINATSLFPLNCQGYSLTIKSLICSKYHYFFNREHFPDILLLRYFPHIISKMSLSTLRKTNDVILTDPSDWESWSHQFKLKAMAARLW